MMIRGRFGYPLREFGRVETRRVSGSGHLEHVLKKEDFLESCLFRSLGTRRLIWRSSRVEPREGYSRPCSESYGTGVFCITGSTKTTRQPPLPAKFSLMSR
ncbi:hypothetical protein DSY3085 [Desulfitobacterium hafniense Y51]|uniref:Uncharacterized protein n=1 Tax=Desulfitobacterium hafniense (strain Y51) TaxID=138119 RepID=Q24SW8_DESHY|nr:hypothetical protein DSY3085 [Desulfitobacterium hafniense Y51]